MLSRCLATFAKSQMPSAAKSFMQPAAYRFSNFSDKLNKLKNKNEGFTAAHQPREDSTLNQVRSDAGLSSFVNRVYKTTGLGVLGALTVSQLSIASGLAFMSPGVCGIGGIVATLIGMIGTMKTEPTHYTEYINGETHLKTKNSPLRVGLFGLGMAGLGLSSSVLFGALNLVNPAILPLSIGITGAVFGSASLYALYKPKGSLLGLGSSLYAGLFGLIGLQIAGLLTQLCIGPNMFTFMCHRADTFIGVGLFTAFVAYDTHVAIQQYEAGNADHLSASIDFVLDFWNILTRVSQILGMFTRD